MEQALPQTSTTQKYTVSEEVRGVPSPRGQAALHGDAGGKFAGISWGEQLRDGNIVMLRIGDMVSRGGEPQTQGFHGAVHAAEGERGGRYRRPPEP